MFEKVNPSHPDKVADRIAGAVVDIAYETQIDPKVAVEVLIGHGICHIIAETSATINRAKVISAVHRIAGDLKVDLVVVPQDEHLARNQADAIRCGDNGIFKGVPVTAEQQSLSDIAHAIYEVWPYDGKYIKDGEKLIICQSNAKSQHLREIYPTAEINPLGDWIGGTDVDTGATNRKLGSDMADSVTGGGLHGKDLSKADVSVNIYAWLKAQLTGKHVELCCAIGDDTVDGIPYSEIVETARNYIKSVGGFEKFAEWGLVFSAKLVCEECGSFFGSKVWHSTDQYRRHIWQCNGKFSNEERCHTPTLDTETIQRLFIQAYNLLMSDRKQTVADCELARKCLTDFAALDTEIERQLAETQVIAEMVKAAVRENASTAQSQEAYLQPKSPRNRTIRRHMAAKTPKKCKIPSQNALKPFFFRKRA